MFTWLVGALLAAFAVVAEWFVAPIHPRFGAVQGSISLVVSRRRRRHPSAFWTVVSDLPVHTGAYAPTCTAPGVALIYVRVGTEM
jgi:hypothetical protein